ncbi:MAG: hydrogenase, partial [Candidatus Omnitrophica bacterium]|nr:hydrogenase [Candidatus Omnitrophota bacterium]
MRYFYLEKKDLGKFVDLLKEQGNKVVAPCKKENQYVFAEVTSAAEMTLEYIPTILPPKKYFFPQTEKLGSFKLNDVKFGDTSLEIIPTVV